MPPHPAAVTVLFLDLAPLSLRAAACGGSGSPQGANLASTSTGAATAGQGDASGGVR